jgi:hypothetical protein
VDLQLKHFGSGHGEQVASKPKKSSRRAVKWQMKNYSRQFGDSKISDDVMIRADVRAPKWG